MKNKFYYSSKYKVIYDANTATSGTVPLDSNSPYIQNSTVTVLDNVGNLAKPSYSFNGWNTKKDGSGISYNANDTFNILQTTVLYAQWIYTGYVAISLPSGAGVIGCMYSNSPSYPKGPVATWCSGSSFSIGLIDNGSISSPYRHMGPGGGGGGSSGSVTAGQNYTFAIYEGTLPQQCGIRLIGISISSVQNGALQQMQGTRTYNMPLGSTTSQVSCYYYDFTVPNSSTDIIISPIYETVTQ